MIVSEGISLGQMATFTQRFLIRDAQTEKPLQANIRAYSIRNDELIGKGWSNENGDLAIRLNADEGEPILIVGQAGDYGEFLFKGMTGKDPIVIRFRKPMAESPESGIPIGPILIVGAFILGIGAYHLLS